ncbi:MAG: RAD55 family ATPase [Archaeoglobaceae archaeon]
MVYRVGIVPLDVQLGGGIPEGRIAIIFEEPGAGAEVFTYHFAVEGARLGERVLYITQQNMLDLKEEINSYFSLRPEEWEYIAVLSLKSSHESKDREYLRRGIYDAMSGIKVILENENFNRVVINDLVYFLKYYEFDDVLDFFGYLVSRAKKDRFSCLTVLPKGLFDGSVEVTLKHSFDIVFELTLKEVETEVQRRLKVIKFRGKAVPKAIMRYDLTDRGVRMESVMRVL